jgi:hypothetical protein
MVGARIFLSRTEGAEDAESVLLVGAVNSCLPHSQLHFLIPTLYFLLRYIAQSTQRAESILLGGAVDSCLPHFQLHFLIPTLYFLLRYLVQRAQRCE